MLLPSIRSLKTGSLLLAALAAAALPAFAGETYSASSKDKNPVIEKPSTEPRFYIDLLAGGEFDNGLTDFISNGNANLNTFAGGFPTPIVDVARARPAAIAVVPLIGLFQARDFQETHDVAVVNGRLELGYHVLPYLSAFVGGTYSHAGGNNRANVGTVLDPTGFFGSPRGRFDLYAGVGQYQAFSGIAGIKLNTPRTILDLLHIPRAIKPYLVLSAGGKYVDDQNIRFYTDNASIVDTGRLRLYEASWVFTAEAQLGYELQLTRSLSINLENGYGYDTAPQQGGSLPGEYQGINRSGSRFYSTVSLGAKLSF